MFPRCRAIVHHGGAGTTQSALLAGKPSVVVAHISEQEFWGNELCRLKVAGKPLKRRSLSAGKLAASIRHTTKSNDFTSRAASIAEAMKKEDGVSTAINLIQQRFTNRSDKPNIAAVTKDNH